MNTNPIESTENILKTPSPVENTNSNAVPKDEEKGTYFQLRASGQILNATDAIDKGVDPNQLTLKSAEEEWKNPNLQQFYKEKYGDKALDNFTKEYNDSIRDAKDYYYLINKPSSPLANTSPTWRRLYNPVKFNTGDFYKVDQNYNPLLTTKLGRTSIDQLSIEESALTTELHKIDGTIKEYNIPNSSKAFKKQDLTDGTIAVYDYLPEENKYIIREKIKEDIKDTDRVVGSWDSTEFGITVGKYNKEGIEGALLGATRSTLGALNNFGGDLLRLPVSVADGILDIMDGAIPYDESKLEKELRWISKNIEKTRVGDTEESKEGAFNSIQSVSNLVGDSVSQLLLGGGIARISQSTIANLAKLSGTSTVASAKLGTSYASKIAMGSLSGVAGQSMKDEAIQAGFSEKEATLAGIVATMSVYATQRLVDPFFKGLTKDQRRKYIDDVIKEQVAKLKHSPTKQINPETLSKDVSKSLLTKIGDFASKAGSGLDEALAGGASSKIGYSTALGVAEGTQEVAEEISNEGLRALMNQYASFSHGNIQGEADDIPKMDFQLSFDSLLAAALGGKIGGFTSGYLSYRKMPKETQKDLFNLVANEQTDEAIEYLDELHKNGKLGSTQFDVKGRVINKDTNVAFINENDFIHSTVKSDILLLDQIWKSSRLNTVFNGEVFDKLTVERDKDGIIDTDKSTRFTRFKEVMQNSSIIDHAKSLIDRKIDLQAALENTKDEEGILKLKEQSKEVDTQIDDILNAEKAKFFYLEGLWNLTNSAKTKKAPLFNGTTFATIFTDLKRNFETLSKNEKEIFNNKQKELKLNESLFTSDNLNELINYYNTKENNKFDDSIPFTIDEELEKKLQTIVEVTPEFYQNLESISNIPEGILKIFSVSNNVDKTPNDIFEEVFLREIILDGNKVKRGRNLVDALKELETIHFNSINKVKVPTEDGQEEEIELSDLNDTQTPATIITNSAMLFSYIRDFALIEPEYTDFENFLEKKDFTAQQKLRESKFNELITIEELTKAVNQKENAPYSSLNEPIKFDVFAPRTKEEIEEYDYSQEPYYINLRDKLISLFQNATKYQQIAERNKNGDALVEMNLLNEDAQTKNILLTDFVNVIGTVLPEEKDKLTDIIVNVPSGTDILSKRREIFNKEYIIYSWFNNLSDDKRKLFLDYINNYKNKDIINGLLSIDTIKELKPVGEIDTLRSLLNNNPFINSYFNRVLTLNPYNFQSVLNAVVDQIENQTFFQNIEQQNAIASIVTILLGGNYIHAQISSNPNNNKNVGNLIHLDGIFGGGKTQGVIAPALQVYSKLIGKDNITIKTFAQKQRQADKLKEVLNTYGLIAESTVADNQITKFIEEITKLGTGVASELDKIDIIVFDEAMNISLKDRRLIKEKLNDYNLKNPNNKKSIILVGDRNQISKIEYNDELSMFVFAVDPIIEMNVTQRLQHSYRAGVSEILAFNFLLKIEADKRFSNEKNLIQTVYGKFSNGTLGGVETTSSLQTRIAELFNNEFKDIEPEKLVIIVANDEDKARYSGELQKYVQTVEEVQGLEYENVIVDIQIASNQAIGVNDMFYKFLLTATSRAKKYLLINDIPNVPLSSTQGTPSYINPIKAKEILLTRKKNNLQMYADVLNNRQDTEEERLTQITEIKPVKNDLAETINRKGLDALPDTQADLNATEITDEDGEQEIVFTEGNDPADLENQKSSFVKGNTLQPGFVDFSTFLDKDGNVVKDENFANGMELYRYLKGFKNTFDISKVTKLRIGDTTSVSYFFSKGKTLKSSKSSTTGKSLFVTINNQEIELFKFSSVLSAKIIDQDITDKNHIEKVISNIRQNANKDDKRTYSSLPFESKRDDKGELKLEDVKEIPIDTLREIISVHNMGEIEENPYIYMKAPRDENDTNLEGKPVLVWNFGEEEFNPTNTENYKLLWLNDYKLSKEEFRDYLISLSKNEDMQPIYFAFSKSKENKNIQELIDTLTKIYEETEGNTEARKAFKELLSNAKQIVREIITSSKEIKYVANTTKYIEFIDFIRKYPNSEFSAKLEKIVNLYDQVFLPKDSKTGESVYYGRILRGAKPKKQTYIRKSRPIIINGEDFNKRMTYKGFVFLSNLSIDENSFKEVLNSKTTPATLTPSITTEVNTSNKRLDWNEFKPAFFNYQKGTKWIDNGILSNRTEVKPFPVTIDGITYEVNNSEAIYYALKFKDSNPALFKEILNMSGEDAKKTFKKNKLSNPPSEKENMDHMRIALKAKFSVEENYKDLITFYKLQPEPEPFIEWNNWGDREWGVDSETGMGENKLGLLLEEVIEEIRKSNIFNTSTTITETEVETKVETEVKNKAETETKTKEEVKVEPVLNPATNINLNKDTSISELTTEINKVLKNKKSGIDIGTIYEIFKDKGQYVPEFENFIFEQFKKARVDFNAGTVTLDANLVGNKLMTILQDFQNITTNDDFENQNTRNKFYSSILLAGFNPITRFFNLPLEAVTKKGVTTYQFKAKTHIEDSFTDDNINAMTENVNELLNLELGAINYTVTGEDVNGNQVEEKVYLNRVSSFFKTWGELANKRIYRNNVSTTIFSDSSIATIESLNENELGGNPTLISFWNAIFNPNNKNGYGGLKRHIQEKYKNNPSEELAKQYQDITSIQTAIYSSLQSTSQRSPIVVSSDANKLSILTSSNYYSDEHSGTLRNKLYEEIVENIKNSITIDKLNNVLKILKNAENTNVLLDENLKQEGVEKNYQILINALNNLGVKNKYTYVTVTGKVLTVDIESKINKADIYSNILTLEDFLYLIKKETNLKEAVENNRKNLNFLVQSLLPAYDTVILTQQDNMTVRLGNNKKMTRKSLYIPLARPFDFINRMFDNKFPEYLKGTIIEKMYDNDEYSFHDQVFLLNKIENTFISGSEFETRYNKREADFTKLSAKQMMNLYLSVFALGLGKNHIHIKGVVASDGRSQPLFTVKSNNPPLKTFSNFNNELKNLEVELSGLINTKGQLANSYNLFINDLIDQNIVKADKGKIIIIDSYLQKTLATIKDEINSAVTDEQFLQNYFYYFNKISIPFNALYGGTLQNYKGYNENDKTAALVDFSKRSKSLMMSSKTLYVTDVKDINGKTVSLGKNYKVHLVDDIKQEFTIPNGLGKETLDITDGITFKNPITTLKEKFSYGNQYGITVGPNTKGLDCATLEDGSAFLGKKSTQEINLDWLRNNVDDTGAADLNTFVWKAMQIMLPEQQFAYLLENLENDNVFNEIYDQLLEEDALNEIVDEVMPTSAVKVLNKEVRPLQKKANGVGYVIPNANRGLQFNATHDEEPDVIKGLTQLIGQIVNEGGSNLEEGRKIYKALAAYAKISNNINRNLNIKNTLLSIADRTNVNFDFLNVSNIDLNSPVTLNKLVSLLTAKFSEDAIRAKFFGKHYVVAPSYNLFKFKVDSYGNKILIKDWLKLDPEYQAQYTTDSNTLDAVDIKGLPNVIDILNNLTTLNDRRKLLLDTIKENNGVNVDASKAEVIVIEKQIEDFKIVLKEAYNKASAITPNEIILPSNAFSSFKVDSSFNFGWLYLRNPEGDIINPPQLLNYFAERFKELNEVQLIDVIDNFKKAINNTLGSRTPGTGFSSFGTEKVVGFIDGNANTVFVSPLSAYFKGEDFDVDKHSNLFKTLNEKGELNTFTSKELEAFLNGDEEIFKQYNFKDKFTNYILDLINQVYLNPINYLQSTRPVGVSKAKDAVAFIGGEKNKLDPFNPFSIAKAEENTQAGKNGVGVFASNTKALGVMIDVFNKISNSNVSVEVIEAITGLYNAKRSEDLSILTNAATDNAKELVLGALNINNTTYNFVTGLIFKGKTINEIASILVKYKEALVIASKKESLDGYSNAKKAFQEELKKNGDLNTFNLGEQIQLLNKFLSLNQKTPNGIDEMVDFISTIKKGFKDSYGLEVDVIKLLADNVNGDYTKQIIDKINTSITNLKNTSAINVAELFKNSEHFNEYGKTLATQIQVLRANSNLAKLTFDLTLEVKEDKEYAFIDTNILTNNIISAITSYATDMYYRQNPITLQVNGKEYHLSIPSNREQFLKDAPEIITNFRNIKSSSNQLVMLLSAIGFENTRDFKETGEVSKSEVQVLKRIGDNSDSFSAALKIILSNPTELATISLNENEHSIVDVLFHLNLLTSKGKSKKDNFTVLFKGEQYKELNDIISGLTITAEQFKTYDNLSFTEKLVNNVSGNIKVKSKERTDKEKQAVAKTKDKTNIDLDKPVYKTETLVADDIEIVSAQNSNVIAEITVKNITKYLNNAGITVTDTQLKELIDLLDDEDVTYVMGELFNSIFLSYSFYEEENTTTPTGEEITTIKEVTKPLISKEVTKSKKEKLQFKFTSQETKSSSKLAKEKFIASLKDKKVRKVVSQDKKFFKLVYYVSNNEEYAEFLNYVAKSPNATITPYITTKELKQQYKNDYSTLVVNYPRLLGEAKLLSNKKGGFFLFAQSPNASKQSFSKKKIYSKKRGKVKTNTKKQLELGNSKLIGKEVLDATVNRIKELFPYIPINVMSASEIEERFDINMSRAKGFVKNGEVYINSNLATADTALHELAHIWLQVIKTVNIDTYNKAISFAKDSERYNEVSAIYTDLNEEDLLDETLASLIGELNMDTVEEAPSLKRFLFNLWKDISEFVKYLFVRDYNPLDNKFLSSISKADTLSDILYIFEKELTSGKPIVKIGEKTKQFLKTEVNMLLTTELENIRKQLTYTTNC